MRELIRCVRYGLVVLVLTSACAAPLQQATGVPAAPASQRVPLAGGVAGRPTVGVAFGGGSARGIAHVGVIRWLEEHRIPVDAAAGTSMGGLIGGAFASGMDAAELRAFIASIDWDELFGASSFEHKNIRRKTDARAYPSRLEFGLRGGIVAPTALNNGQSVELLLARVAAPYFDVEDFDQLPTPFRTVAVDLLSARQVVLRSGSLADALRATMSLPLIFPPVQLNGQVLVDGGVMNNVPADVVRGMGADHVVAINVGELDDRESVRSTMFGIASETMDAMMRANARQGLEAADVVVNVPLREFGSLDWRRAAALEEAGYRAADAMRDQLLPLALSDADFEVWQRTRQERRRRELPVPAFIQLDGFAPADTSRMNALLARHVRAPVQMSALEQDIAEVAGLDRYESVTWQLVQDPARGTGLRLRARIKPYAPPFMMLGGTLENTTSSDFRITASARYLTFDLIGPGSELRIDGTIGSDPSAGGELYVPVGKTPMFVAPYAGIRRVTLDLIEEDTVVARYAETAARAGLNVGVNLDTNSDVRLGAYLGRTSDLVRVGNPGLPELSGREIGAVLAWRVDTQDNPVVPRHGVLSEVRFTHVFDLPDVKTENPSVQQEDALTQLTATANRFWSVGSANHLFAYGTFGTSFNGEPLRPDQFSLGTPFRLGAYQVGELTGAHYYAATGGYFRRTGRLPDFVGGPVYLGAWLENGDAFGNWRDATWRSNGGAGLVLDTLVGPMVLAGSWGFDGRWRTYLAVGRVFR